MADIPLWLGTLTPAGILSVAVSLIMFGRLIPESMHERIVATLTDALARAERRAERAEAQVDKLTDTLGTHTHLLESIRETSEGPKP